MEDPRNRPIPTQAPACLKINEAAQISVQRIGPEGTPIIAVDDFLANPQALRDHAQTLAWLPATSAFPGVRASVGLNLRPMIDWCAGTILREICGLHGEPMPLFPHLDEEAHEAQTFSIATVGNEVFQTEWGRQIDEFGAMEAVRFAAPHTDLGWFNLLLHLSLPKVDAGGTAFWKHRRTGLQTFCRSEDPIFAQKAGEALGLDLTHRMLNAFADEPCYTKDDALESLFSDGEFEDFRGASTETWECLTILPAKFNRLYLFPAPQFHSVVLGEQVSTASFDDVRLTMNLFIPPYGADVD